MKLTLQYDGTRFHGWQVQPGLRTVQGELDGALSRLADRPVKSIAAGRTDAGVHATGQVASFGMPAKWTAPELAAALNAILAEDIRVSRAESVEDGFHALRSATARGYVYRLGTTAAARSPFRRSWCWPLDGAVDRAVLERCAAALEGEHSFRGYAKSGQEYRGHRCTVHAAGWRDWSEGLELRIVANRFLHHMVRYVVGTLVEAARGRRPEADVAGLLDESELDRLVTSSPAPPAGLFLARVYYGDEQPNPEGPEYEDLP